MKSFSFSAVAKHCLHIIVIGLLIYPPALLASTFDINGVIITVTKDDEFGGDKNLKENHMAKAKFRITQKSYNNHPLSYLGRIMDWTVKAPILLDGGDTSKWYSTACMINGKFVPNSTFVRAIEPGMHGYWYESTFLDLQVTPDYHVGAIVSHDEQNKTFVMDSWRGDREYHYPETLDVEMSVSYSDETQFLVEGDLSDRDTVLNRTGIYIQSHPPREQIILLESPDQVFDSSIYPLNGGRGGANRYCSMGTFVGYDNDSAALLYLRGDGITVKTTRPRWVMDGKMHRIKDIMRKPGRSVGLAHYRTANADRPLFAFARTMDDEIRGEVTAVNGDSITILATDWQGATATKTIELDPQGTLYLDGAKGQSASAVVVGQNIRIFPKRPQTIVALKKRTPIYDRASRRKQSKIVAEGYLPVASFRGPRRVVGQQELTFDATSSYAFNEFDNATIVSYDWDFDDGTTASGAVVTHTFANRIGRYDVALTVTDSRGHSHTRTHHVAVYPELMPAARPTSAGLQPGFHIKVWPPPGKGVKWQDPKSLMTGEPIREEILTRFSTKIPGGTWRDNFPIFTEDPKLPDRAPYRMNGFIEIPQSGWLVLGSMRDFNLSINGEQVLSLLTGNDNNYDMGQRTWLYLEAGLHEWEFEAYEDFNKSRFALMYPNGDRVVPANAPANIEEDLMWRLYRPLDQLLFHDAGSP